LHSPAFRHAPVPVLVRPVDPDTLIGSFSDLKSFEEAPIWSSVKPAIQARARSCAKPEEALCKVPVFRPVAIRLLSLLTHEEPDILTVADVLRSDPGFSAEILAVANSAAFVQSNRVNTVQKAIMVLGTDRTRMLVTRTALHGMVRGMQQDATIQNCWIHSRAAAAAAVWLAPYYRVHPDRAYTAALIHDIGRLGLLSAHGSRYADLLQRITGTNASVMDAERLLFHVDHCEAGAWLTRTWGLPAEFQETASSHHQAIDGARCDINGLAACACALAQVLGFRAAPLVESETLEALLERVPRGMGLLTQFSARDLSGLVCRELEIAK
jgi:HD-like signal output (HDOD) protein